MKRPRILHITEVSSTNDMAKSQLRSENSDAWDVILADHQTQGRGQRENVWISSPGQNLTMSIILRSPILLGQTPWRISMATALSIRDLMASETNAECYVKWPNDIILADKKIAGVLIENIWSGESIKYSIIGIGINLRQRDFGKVKTAISLCECAEKISDTFYYSDKIYLKLVEYLSAGHPTELINQYQCFLYRMYEQGCVEINGEAIEDSIVGVNDEGMLITKNATGTIAERKHPEARVQYRTAQ